MRKLLGVLAAALIAGAIFWTTSERDEGSSPRASETQVAGAEGLHRSRRADQSASAGPQTAVARGGEAAAAPRAAEEEAREGVTPPLEVPATAADGFIEVEVRGAGAALTAAEVKLYFRGPADRAAGHARWRVAGGGKSGRDGLVKMPARPGAYLVVAQAERLAPARKELVRPQGEPVTHVRLELQAGLSLSGRTVAKTSKEAVPLASVLLTPVFGPQGGGRRGGQQRKPDAPPEELAHGTSDQRGNFRVDGLAQGTYRIEASAPGHSKAVAASVAVPRDGELVMELSPAGFIEGTVIGGDGQPAAGAQVAAAGGGQLASATASEKGAFSIEVEPRSYKLSAARGHESGTLDKLVSVAPGATVRGVQITLGPAASLAGVVFTSSRRLPVPGAQVTLAPYRGQGTVASAVTDQSGNFALEGVPPGSYDLYTAADSFAPDVRSGLTVLQGQRFPLEIQLSGLGGVEGFVKSAVTGLPVAGAIVSASSGAINGGPGGGRFALILLGGAQPADAPAQVVADAQGHYQVAGLPPGRARLMAHRSGSDLGDTQSADVVENGLARADFSLKDEGVLTGRVLRKSGAPLSNPATVRAMPIGGGFGFAMGGNLPNVQTDAIGSYRLVLPVGTYNVVASTDAGVGLAMPRSQNLATIEAGQTASKDLVIDDSADEYSLSGTVLEPAGDPSPGAMVRINGRGFGAMAVADEQGKFTLTGARAQLPSSFSVVAVNGGRTVTVPATPDQTQLMLRLQAGARLKGHVTGAAAVQGFRVVVSPMGSGGWAMRATAQNLEFAADTFQIDDVPPQDTRVQVTTRDGRSGEAETTLASGQTGDIEVQLHDVVTITGRVVGADGAPLKGAFAAADGDMRNGSDTSSDGRFKLSNLTAGEHELAVMVPSYSRTTRKFTVGSGQPLDLGDVRIDPPKAAPGTIGASLRPDGTNVTVVQLTPAGPADQGGVRVGDILIAIDGVPVGNAGDASARLKGAPGSSVTLTLRRAGNALVLQVVRAV